MLSALDDERLRDCEFNDVESGKYPEEEADDVLFPFPLCEVWMGAGLFPLRCCWCW
jgi:hypothetical protein